VNGVKWKEKVEAAAVAEAVAEGTTPFSFEKFNWTRLRLGYSIQS
jgi:hypothetical protein